MKYFCFMTPELFYKFLRHRRHQETELPVTSSESLDGSGCHTPLGWTRRLDATGGVPGDWAGRCKVWPRWLESLSWLRKF